MLIKFAALHRQYLYLHMSERLLRSRDRKHLTNKHAGKVTSVIRVASTNRYFSIVTTASSTQYRILFTIKFLYLLNSIQYYTCILYCNLLQWYTWISLFWYEDLKLHVVLQLLYDNPSIVIKLIRFSIISNMHIPFVMRVISNYSAVL